MRESSKIKGLFFAIVASFCLAPLAQAQEDRAGINWDDFDGGLPGYYCQEVLGVPGCAESPACEAAVCAIDPFCCDISWDGICVDEAQMFDACLISEQEPEPIATFLVQKGYDDFNPAPVEVTIECNTGLPLMQTTTIDTATSPPNDFDSVNFVVRDFNSGELDCEITETVPDGYQPLYAMVEDGVYSENNVSCLFEDVEHGEMSVFFEHQYCVAANFLIPSDVDVTKEWIDENPEFNPINFAEATWSCTNVPDRSFPIVIFPPAGIQRSIEVGSSYIEAISGSPTGGTLSFLGNPGLDGFQTYGNWNGGTECSVTEQVTDSGVEADDSDCQDILLFPGDDAACTIVNTRLYEGIPTMGRYGVMVLTLLMLGLGLVAYRRFV